MSGKCTNRTCYNPPAPGRKSCQRCLDGYRAQSSKARHLARVAGYCTMCRKRRPERDRTTCPECLDYMRAYEKRRVA